MADLSDVENFNSTVKELKNQLEGKVIKFVPAPRDDEDDPATSPDPVYFYHDKQALTFFSFKQRELGQLYDFSRQFHSEEKILPREDFLLGVCEKSDGIHTSAKILATLIIMEVPADSTAWYTMLSTSVDSDFCDQMLPCNYNKAKTYFGEHYAYSFIHHQFGFCPLILEEGANKTVSASQMQCPPPFENETVVGSGQFGFVYRVKLAKGSGLSGKSIVARKDIKDSNAREWLVAEHLQKGPIEHRNIVKTFARLNYPKKVSIFMELAACDLEYHMRRGSPEGPEVHLKNVMLQRIAGIAAALGYLHKDLRNDYGEHIIFIHLDLKPKNILVFLDQEEGDFTLKVADFGISCVKVESRRASTGDYIPYTRTGIDQANSCVAPEGLVTDGPITPSCDTWSFGCVLAIFMAWIHNGWEEVDRFRRLRHHAGSSGSGSTDGFAMVTNKKRYFSMHSTWQGENGVRYGLNDAVGDWFQEVIRTDTEIGVRFQKTWNLLKNDVLQPDPISRKLIYDVFQELDSIASQKIQLKSKEVRQSRVISSAHQPKKDAKSSWSSPALRFKSSRATSSATEPQPTAMDTSTFRLEVNAGNKGVRGCAISLDGRHVAHVCDSAIFYTHIRALTPQLQVRHRPLDIQNFCSGATWLSCHFNQDFLFAVPSMPTNSRFKILIFPLRSLIRSEDNVHAFEVVDDRPRALDLELLATHPSHPAVIGCVVKIEGRHIVMTCKLDELEDKMRSFDPETAHGPIQRITCHREELKDGEYGAKNKPNDLKFASDGTLLFLAHSVGPCVIVTAWDVSTKSRSVQCVIKDMDKSDITGRMLSPLTALRGKTIIVMVHERFAYCWTPDSRAAEPVVEKSLSQASYKITLACFDEDRSCTYLIGSRRQGKPEFAVYKVPLDQSGAVEFTNLGLERANTASMLFEHISRRPFCTALVKADDADTGPPPPLLLLVDYRGNVEVLTLP